MDNKSKVLQISKELGLSHIGSNLSCLPILEEIYANKKPEDKVILDNAHAHLAHLVVKEDTNPIIAAFGTEEMRKANRWLQRMIEQFGIHCDRKAGCDASGGSLGHGIGIAIGYALANPDKTIYCIVSDGSMMEGSNAEALRLIKTLSINNIEIHANFNSHTALAKIDLDYLEKWIMGFGVPVIVHRTTNNLNALDSVGDHYQTLND